MLSPFRMLSKVAILLAIFSGRFAALADDTNGGCEDDSSALDSCMGSEGATQEQVSACNTCIQSVYTNYGFETGDACAETNPQACSALEACYGDCFEACFDQMFTYGECGVNAARTANGGEDCEAMSCDLAEVTGDPNATDPPAAGSDGVMFVSSPGVWTLTVLAASFLANITI
ncbi:hypothetical protein IV203_017824 [Nitzschia inconspicua]|uniref:Uncharacterized protein n=1 Tax=Nitzschia inconspicua TaxID=303405 RepID=A0A9K3Q5C1_9STRA|nr:hypothetical protein IV203_020525 [Nitzschia inconspicua]KAG7371683.1 hypothetical protein IV203_017824 [Nitzschia inconspicua]